VGERERERERKKKREERDLSTNVLLLCFYPFFPKIKTQEVEEENQDWSLVLPGLMQVSHVFVLSNCTLLSTWVGDDDDDDDGGGGGGGDGWWWSTF
jgi:hypothetical protein